MSQWTWPPVTATNPSVGITGQAAPASATEIGGINSGNLVGVAVTASGSVIIDGSGTPVPISGTVTANQGTANASPWNENIAKFGGTSVSIGQQLVAASLPVTIASNQGPLNVAQSGTWDMRLDDGTGNAITSTGGALDVNLKTSAITISENIAQWGGANTTLGQKVLASSVPVAIASDQSAIPASQSGTWNITNISGTVSLPTGASTSALQTTGNTSLATIATNTGKVPIAATGTFAEISNLTNAAQTFTAPVGAVGFLLEALSDNTGNLRWKSGATATTSSGMRLEPGRDSGYIPLGANISVICETAATNQYVSVQWVGQ